MRQGHLSEYFEGVALKQLSAVEATPEISHQHEFNGVAALRAILGDDNKKLDARFLYLSDEPEKVVADANVTWYDARKAHPTRSEYRLYFPTTAVSELAAAGDLLVIAKRQQGTLLVLVAQGGSTIESQVRWLFGGQDVANQFSLAALDGTEDPEVGFAARMVLEEIGVEPHETDDALRDALIRTFPHGFPTTAAFSNYARGSVPVVDCHADPDLALIEWMEREEKLFRLLERHLVQHRLHEGFGSDVDAFVEFSLSVQNRRKARAGRALENHMCAVFDAYGIRYSRGAITENKNKPDFLFPGIVEYRDVNFPSNRLSMLGAKSTCKDRWRQVLAEAKRLEEKHLLTLEPGISENQTAEMQASAVRLVVPTPLHPTYKAAQKAWLLTLRDFISLVRTRQ
jgi:hypothetical protein